MPSTSELPPLLVRADADAFRGTGHVMRCLALTQGWQAQGGSTLFISRCDSPALRRRIEASGAGLMPLNATDSVDADLQTTLAQIRERERALVVLDGYHFDSQYRRALRVPGHLLMALDDTAHLADYHADILLNQNLGASRLRYRCGAETTLLLGPSYALLRPEFQNWRRRPCGDPGSGQKILVTLGGSDPDNFTLRVIAAIEHLNTPGINVRVVVGPANPHLAALTTAAGDSRAGIEVLTGVSDMAALMAWADVAVSGGGTTCWELACMGVPTLVIVLADNQKQIAKELAAAGIVENLGWHRDMTVERLGVALDALIDAPVRRRSMSQKGRSLVDGRGSERVVQTLLDRAQGRAA
jgi:UDP-2,4-diacetamido-2,4,6-trideoxy-beta-L-altropyranose hydrolase